MCAFLGGMFALCGLVFRSDISDVVCLDVERERCNVVLARLIILHFWNLFASRLHLRVDRINQVAMGNQSDRATILYFLVHSNQQLSFTKALRHSTLSRVGNVRNPIYIVYVRT